MSGARGDAKNAPYPAISGAECKLKPANLSYAEFVARGNLKGPDQFRLYETKGFRTPTGKVELKLSTGAIRMAQVEFQYAHLHGKTGQGMRNTQPEKSSLQDSQGERVSGFLPH